jgi:hypothetical protein
VKQLSDSEFYEAWVNFRDSDFIGILTCKKHKNSLLVLADRDYCWSKYRSNSYNWRMFGLLLNSDIQAREAFINGWG